MGGRRGRWPPQRGGHLQNSHGLRAAPGAARPPLYSQGLPCSSLALPVAVTWPERTASPPSFAAVGRAVRAMGSHSYSQAAQPGSIVLRSVTQNLAPSPQCLQGRAHWLPRLKDGLRQRGTDRGGAFTLFFAWRSRPCRPVPPCDTVRRFNHYSRNNIKRQHWPPSQLCREDALADLRGGFRLKGRGASRCGPSWPFTIPARRQSGS